ncbi:MAG: three-Cys-motif partner protein TcmP, partial [Blastocatellia bacterium]
DYMPRKRKSADDDPFLPMELPEQSKAAPEPKVKALNNPIWTENKARLVERYLYYFVQITKHGTYIDGFAGPQKDGKPEMWAAKLVLESEPRWLRHFYLYDIGRKQVSALEKIKEAQPERDSRGKKINREIHVQRGNFNECVLDLLNSGKIKQSEATFCLLDQRTFECKWSTLKALAQYKTAENNKIELFYFLAIHWLKRALAGLKNTKGLEEWWGREDWRNLLSFDTEQCKELVVERMKSELGYKSVKPWPIFMKRSERTIMYYMIHATDHPQAPILMRRAYENAVKPKEPIEQLSLLKLIGGEQN